MDEQSGQREKPQTYLCAKCAAEVVPEQMRKDGIPSMYAMTMALAILRDAKAPDEPLCELSKWVAETYLCNGQPSELKPEERDRLKLLAWRMSMGDRDA